MKKIVTDTKLLRILRMLDDYTQLHNLSIRDHTSHEAFVTELSKVLQRHHANPALLHGFRAQTMFAYLAAALGGCKIVVEEDAGEFYVASPDFGRPDFRILTRTGKEFFVEVKNFYRRSGAGRLSLKPEYVKKLANYAEAFQKPLLFAIYWARWGLWSLNPLSDFTRDRGAYSISMEETFVNDHKALLGDFMVGIPKPFMLRLYTDPDKPRTLDSDGHAPFTVGRATFLAGGNEITNAFEEKLAWFYLRYGSWEDVEHPAHVENEQLLSFDIQPVRDDPNPQQDYLSIGFLSQMIARQFDEMTLKENMVQRLTPRVHPVKLGIVHPADFHGTVLRLWRFVQQPARPIFAFPF